MSELEEMFYGVVDTHTVSLTSDFLVEAFVIAMPFDGGYSSNQQGPKHHHYHHAAGSTIAFCV